ncbi:hypothetical protein INR49_011118, partial [Caranx melampygus]
RTERRLTASRESLKDPFSGLNGGDLGKGGARAAIEVDHTSLERSSLGPRDGYLFEVKWEYHLILAIGNICASHIMLAPQYI